MKIIAALDGSQHSSATLNFLLSYHWPAGSWIKLVHVLPCERGLMSYVMHAFGQENECDTENVSLVLAGIAEELARSMHNVSVSSEVLSGDPVDSILSFAGTFHPDLMVTGCRKKTAVDSILLGSVSQKLLEGINCPVAIVRGDSARLDPDRGSNVLVAVDDSEHSAAAVEWLQWQEWMKHSHIALLSVTEPVHHSMMDGVKSASDNLLTYQAEKMLIESLLEKWGTFIQRGGNAREITRGTVDGSPSETILNGAKNWPANLIVMGAHGRTGIVKIIMGSVSQHISTHANCTVLIVKGVQSKLYEFDRTKILDSMVLDDIAAEQTKPGPSGIPASNWTGSSGHSPPTGLF